MRILLIGNGAREHAIAAALAAEPDTATREPHELHAAPGNPGLAQLATCHNIDPLDPAAVADLGVSLQADLVVIGPEAPLTEGVADAVRMAGLACFGPSAAAARIEGSKSFAKDVMAAAGVPTGMAHVCADADQLARALDSFGAPYVVKADGLAAGKGVVVTSDRGEAMAHGAACMADGGMVVVEEYLDGPEVSLFCIVDGDDIVPLAPAQDFKRLDDGDAGPNTGGMGSYSPLPWAPPTLSDEVVERVARPTVAELARRGIHFNGVLYCGLALTSRGLRVVEFNARFGDPETQVVLPRLATPLATVLYAAATGHLGDLPPLKWRDEAAVCVVLAAAGYPGAPTQGAPIVGIDRAEQLPGVHVLHAGTARHGDDLVTAGGRVLSVIGTGPTLMAARERAYTGIAAIDMPGAQHRTDIALAAASAAIADGAKLAGGGDGAPPESADASDRTGLGGKA